MKSLPSRRFSRFGIAKSAGRSGSTAAAQSEGGADTTVSASQSEVTASPSTILNDGSTTSTITVTLRNASGVPLSGKTITLSSTGSNNTIVQPGTTNGSGVATGTIATTTAETKTITAVAEAITITDTATVTALSSITPEFASDWRTATGSGSSALLDTSGITAPLVWTIEGGENTVVANSGLGWTASPAPTNVLRVVGVDGADEGGIIRIESGLALPNDDEPIYYRWYARFDMDYPTTDTNTHPFQDGLSAGSANWLFNYLNTVSTTQYAVELQLNGQSTGAIASWDGPTLDKGAWYRVELEFIQRSSTTYNMDVRIYDIDNVLVATGDDFSGGGYGGYPALTLTEFNASYTFAYATRASMAGLNCGTNDSLAEFGPTWGYQAAVVRSVGQTWPGAFGNVTGEV